MDSYSSILDEEKNNNRSDPSRMNTKTQKPLAQLRPEIFGDAAVKDQILMIQQMCEDVDPEVIALVFHECNQNMQKTIARIKAGELQDGEWQTAKSTSKKKNHNNHNQGDQTLNGGGTLSDSERSLSQRTSPTSSLRSGHRRNDQYQHPSSSSSRTDGRRRGNDSNRNKFNSRYSARTNPTHKPVPTLETPLPSEITVPLKQSNENNIPPITSSSIDEYEFVDGSTQSLTFDNSQKKIPIPSSSKRRIPSSIPQVPVSMHPTVQFSTEPIDIQFGDIQWNDSVPTAVSPSSDQEDVNTENHDVQDTVSTNYINHQPTNDIDNQLSSSLSITDPTIPNNLSIVSSDGTSHLSDHLTPTSSSIPNQYSSQSQEPIQIPITRLPPTSQYPPNNFQQTNTNTTTPSASSAFTPFNRVGNYSSVPREYSQTNNWNPQASNYKTNSKNTLIPTGTYPQQHQPSYQISPQQQQQQIFFGAYQYPSMPPAVVQFITPIEGWSPTGYPTTLESYPYATANYVPAYPSQPQYHQPTKYDQHSYDKDFFAHYGQPQVRLSNSDLSSQPTTKDTQSTSKLSPTAATFSQGASLTASPSGTALYLNPIAYTVPNYYQSMSGTDRTLSYSSVDNRDNRNGANNRTNYYHHGQQQQQQQQQRTQNNNVLNSTWHS